MIVPEGAAGDPFLFDNAGTLSLAGVASVVLTDINNPEPDQGQEGIAFREVHLRVCTGNAC